MNEKLERLESLSPLKRALFEKLMKEKAAKEGGSSIPCMDKSANIPLSHAEQRLWYIEQLDSGSASYNASSALKLTGILDVKALRSSLENIVERHNILRSYYRLVDGRPMRFVRSNASIEYSFEELEHLDVGKQKSVLRSKIEAETARAFDLETGPLLRIKLLKLCANEHVLVLTMHHIVSDGWSLGIIVNEFIHLYKKLSGNQLPSLAPLSIQYGDYAEWQLGRLNKATIEQQLQYWGTKLSGLAPLLDFPTDRPRPSVLSSQGGEVGFSLEEQASKKLRDLARKENCTLFVLLLCAFKTLIYRYANIDDIPVGSTIANRPLKELEELVGIFVNSLTLRTKISGSMSFRNLIQSVRSTTIEAYENQDVPFEQVVESLKVERSLSYAPITQVRFVLNNVPFRELELPGLEVEPIRLEHVPAKMDLLLSMSDDQKAISGSLQYSKDLFETSTIEQLVDYFQYLLVQIAENPDSTLVDLQLTDHKVLLEKLCKHETGLKNSFEQVIHKLFEYHADIKPDKVAIVVDDRQYTYEEINARANQLAWSLIERGISAEKQVGIAMPYSQKTIVSILGVLKSGASFVPIDIKFPRQRVLTIFRDAEISLLLTDESTATEFQELDVDQLILDQQSFSDYSSNNPDLDINPKQQAYIIYTSGSTGTPKGVCIEHRALANYLFAVEYRINAGNNPQVEMASMSSVAADLGYTALFGAICHGRILRIIPESSYLEAAHAKNILKNQKIDFLKIVPSHMATLLSVGEDWRLPAKGIVFGGEALQSDVVKKVRSIDPELRILNHYGPTEGTVGSLTYEVPLTLAGGHIPIGKPLANTQAYVLDERLEPVACGVTGDLYIGGANLARGYRNSPARTAMSFLPNPFAGSPGSRIYKTGDRARQDVDGNIYFLGRKDQQIKVNGFRVEAGEVETAIKSIPGVRDCTVNLLKLGKTSDSLTAFIVIEDDAVSEASLRDQLAVRLPEYMIPASIEYVDTIPRLVNGKIDWVSLKEKKQLAEKRESVDKPITATEQVIAQIWSEELKLDDVSRKDDFFRVGGHSLQAVLVVYRICEKLEVELSVSALLSNSTLKDLASFVDTLLNKNDDSMSDSLVPQPRGAVIPISLAQERLWFLYQRDKCSTAYYMPSALEINGPLDIDIFERSVNGVMMRHESLRTTFNQNENGPCQVVHDIPISGVEIIDLRGMGEERKEIILKEHLESKVFRPLDLEKGPLFRVTLLRMEEERNVLVTCIHHILSDGWSQRILLNDLFIFYSDNITKNKQAPEPLPVQYADYAIWERKRMTPDVQNKEIKFWKRKLDNAPLVLRVPTDYPRTGQEKNERETCTFRIPHSVQSVLESFCQKKGFTLYNLLLFSFKILLSRYSSQTDVTVGTTVANRDNLALKNVVGFFINQLALRSQIDEGAQFDDSLLNESESVKEAFSNVNVPFSTIVQSIDFERIENITPVFQHLFVLQNIPGETFGVQNLEVTPLSLSNIDNQESKFDLTLMVGDDQAGLQALMIYNAGLFRKKTIERMGNHYINILKEIAVQPDITIKDIKMYSQKEIEQQEKNKINRNQRKIAGLANARRRTVSLRNQEVVDRTTLSGEVSAPPIYTPLVSDVNLSQWIENRREDIDQDIGKFGGVVFRGFDGQGGDFFQIAKTVSGNSLMEEYGDLPKAGDRNCIYKSTPYPENQTIHFHNESSHLDKWPGRIMFSCVTPPETGGETAIVDCRAVYKSLDKKIIDLFDDYKVIYIRNFHNRIDVSWKQFFNCETKNEVEEKCRHSRMDFDWKEGGVLETRKLCAAVRRHPTSGENVFFNQILLFHPACLDDATYEGLIGQFNEKDFPRNVCFGNGKKIDSGIIKEIMTVMDEHSYRHKWEQGDIVVLDNMLSAHARLPFKGERKIVVAIGSKILETA